ncbi:hypothetical protein BDN70DRAFT_876257 [Pholiota conissans]|uniref:Uncharacterized protein n=1 Tax=Pholiota conissans TaxID=109636 RepID=A0A9P5Z6E9_9AGAR|nr:hypothetical protein BDN70DRAFT_876257 [Pholiota conissans]
MFRGNFNYPDLDVLESPLLSSAPFTAAFSNIPGSAIAEKIFNDPESWGDDDEDRGDFPEDVENEQLVWLTEELEKVIGKVAGNEPDDDLDASTPTEKGSLIATPVSSLPPHFKASLKRDPSIAWKGIAKRGTVRPISLAGLFDHQDEDFSNEVQQQLSKILESGGIPHHLRPYPHSSALSPPSTSGTTSTLDSPLQIQTAHTTGNREDPSPVTIYSASATLSFLEWYGIYPDSPRMDLRRSIMQPPKSARQRGPMLHVPSPRHASRPASLLATPVALPTKRASSVPPPGLNLPSEEPREQKAASPTQRNRSPSPPPRVRSPSPMGARPLAAQSMDVRPTRAVSTERGCSLPHAEPPPYEHTTSLQRSESTPSRRRLPSIPPESGSNSRSSTPPVQAPPVAAAVAVAHPPSRTVTPPQAIRPPPRTVTPPSLQHHAAQTVSRPCSSIRSPPLGPAGPRTRARGRDSTGTPGISATLGHRPPVLRL